MIPEVKPKGVKTNVYGVVTVLVLSTAIASGEARGVPKTPFTAASNLMVDQEVTVTTRVSGVVESIDAERGESVKKGQPLATLDQREFRLDFRAAEETFNVAASDLKRYEELFRLSLCSQAELEQKRSRQELARVELERARLVIDRSVVRAPFDGLVADRFVRVGEKVLLDEHKPLFRVMALEPLLARAYLPAVALGSVKVGDKVVVVATDFPEARSSGHVTFVSPVVDPASGSVQVIVKVQRDVRKVMRPGLAVKMTFETGAPSAASSAPAR